MSRWPIPDNPAAVACLIAEGFLRVPFMKSQQPDKLEFSTGNSPSWNRSGPPPPDTDLHSRDPTRPGSG